MTLAPDPAVAALLDALIDDVCAGRPVDREALLARHPELASALAGLDQILGVQATVIQDSANLTSSSVPEQIGPYQIKRELGVGSFGVVYLAHDPQLQRQVALKLLHPGRLDQPEVVQRFQREACAIARLKHPGIVRLFDYSRQGPPLYLVTEYVEGIDPRQWCRERQAGAVQVAELVARMAEALEHAHALGVCHRDLKPGNILIDEAGQPHILDFGLARLDMLQGELTSPATGSDAGPAGKVPRSASALRGSGEGQAFPRSAPTAEGDILGSLAYMAPEQASGHSHVADARSDVYALGVILYELLTGRLPFDGPPHSLIARVIEDPPPPPRTVKRSIPTGLEAICLKALAKKPQDRYASAASLVEDLQGFLQGKPIKAQRRTWLTRLQEVLGRRHPDTQPQRWTPLLVLVGSTILAGCIVANYLEWNLTGGDPRGSGGPWNPTLWWSILFTKACQVGLMLYWAWRLRPLKEVHLTGAERQIWSLVPAYYGGFLTLALANLFLDPPIPIAPVLAMLSGGGFITLGPTIWGWGYVWGVVFFALAILIACWPPFGLTLLGVGWFTCLLVGSVHVQYPR